MLSNLHVEVIRLGSLCSSRVQQSSERQEVLEALLQLQAASWEEELAAAPRRKKKLG